MTGEYAHPVEQMILGVGTVFGPVLFARHITTVWIWMFVRLFQVVDCHSGYNFPWSLNRLLPFYGGAEYHDFHHETFVSNIVPVINVAFSHFYCTSFRPATMRLPL